MLHLKNGIAMERIELFDKYIKNQLSPKERNEFDARMESDQEFASDFKVYLLTVDGVCREARQDNLDFGMAIKGLSKEQLKEIIGNRRSTEIKAERLSDSKSKAIRFKPWIWQAASVAAVIVIAFTIVFNIQKQSRYAVDNAIYACADLNQDLVRAGGEPIDITLMSDDELKARTPELVTLYETATSTDDVAVNGYALAMAYVRLHDRVKAKKVLTQLINKFDDNEEYAGDVAKWQTTLKLLK